MSGEQVEKVEKREERQENKMGVMPVNRLLITMALPMIVSMIVQALYNIVDSMFVSQISENALTAVSLAFPVQNLMIAVGAGTGVGINAILSRSLGERKFETANQIAENGIFLGFLSYLAFLVIGVAGSRIFFSMQTKNEEIIEYGIEYMMICCACSIGFFMQITFERLLQSTGKTFYTMITQGTGAIINIILDPILIFGYFNMPKMGVAGAAAATVIGQIIAAILAIYFNITKNKDITLKISQFRPSGYIIKSIYAVGVPSIIMSSIGSVMTFGMNKILISFTSTATAVFGVYFKLQSFIFMPVFGLNNGMVPIVSYNYGAGKEKRIVKTVKLSVAYATGMMLIGVLVFWGFTPQLLGIFNASESMLEIGVPALRHISISFLMAGFNIIILSVCQALGHGLLSLSVSAVRQLVFLLPCAFILSRTAGLSAVWWAFPFAEVFALCMSANFMRYIYKKEISPLKERETLPYS